MYAIRSYYDPGYDIEHSDTHLWYHGTIDTTGVITDGTESAPENAGWYNGAMGPRTANGYYFSRIVGGDRPADGITTELGGSASRVAVNLSSATWPSLVSLAVTTDPAVLLGQDIA